MASTFSTNLALELIGTGDQAGSWGNTTNTNLGTLIEQAISGYVTQGVTTGNTTSITIPDGATGVARNMFIELTGTGGTNTVLAVPANKKLYFIYNNTSGAVTVKVGAGTGVSVAATEKKILVSNGTDIVEATSYLTAVGGSLTLTTLTATSATITNLTSTSLTLSNNPTLSGGTANGVLYLNGSKVATSGSALTFDGTGKLGVGTTTPVAGVSAGFEAVGEIWATTASSNSNQIRLSPATSGANIIYSTYAGSGSYLPLAFNVSGSEQMRLTSTGLGIGTASPIYKLHVENNAASTTNIAVLNTSASSGAYAQVRVQGDSGIGYFGYAGSGNAAGGLYDADCVYLASESTAAALCIGTSGGSAPIRFFTNGSTAASERMRLDSSGNLGLGVTPTNYGAGYTQFVVSGSTVPIIDLNVGSTRTLSVVATSTTPTIKTVTNTPLIFGTNDTERARIDSSGNLGIGTTSPTSLGSGYQSITTNGTNGSGFVIKINGTDASYIYQNSTALQLVNTQATPIYFFTSNTERARITTTGNLLVGTTTDVASRSGTISDISGNVRAIPRTGSAKTAVYTLTVSDVGQFVELGTGGGIDVPNGVFSTGDVVSVFNNTTGNRTISLTITTAYIAGTDADKASVTLATRGVATVLFISNSVCVVSGNVT